jgi:hypothetical protein
MNMRADLLARIAADELGFCPQGVAIAALIVEGYAVLPAEEWCETRAVWANVELSPEAWERERPREGAREAARMREHDAWLSEVLRGIAEAAARRAATPRARGPWKRGRKWSEAKRQAAGAGR